MTVRDVLKMCEAEDTLIVQVGGPSGNCISPKQFDRKIAYEDLGTGGAFTIFNKTRDLLSVVRNHMEFFVHETCGFCVPCRAGNAILEQSLHKIMIGNGTQKDLDGIKSLSKMVKMASRCGLGQTSPNPLLTSIENFPEVYSAKIRKDLDYLSQFDMSYAVADSSKVTGRNPISVLQSEE
jgi:[NiFe] hydrogenase diaphorase moiety large subunit